MYVYNHSIHGWFRVRGSGYETNPNPRIWDHIYIGVVDRGQCTWSVRQWRVKGGRPFAARSGHVWNSFHWSLRPLNTIPESMGKNTWMVLRSWDSKQPSFLLNGDLKAAVLLRTMPHLHPTTLKSWFRSERRARPEPRRSDVARWSQRIWGQNAPPTNQVDVDDWGLGFNLSWG